MDRGRVTCADARRVATSLGARPVDPSAPPAPPAPPAPLTSPDTPQTIPLPPYVVGETIEEYEARALLALTATLLGRTGHHKKVAAALSLSPRALYKRLQRAKTIAA